MKQTAIFPGRYVQGQGALAELSDEVSRLGSTVLIVVGGTAHKTIVPAYLPDWSEQFDIQVEPFSGECSDREIERLSRTAKDQSCDVIVGMGGGKAIDTAKAVAHAAGAATVIVPTIASTDAPTSAVSVIYTSDGAFQRYLFVRRNPDLVLVDTDIIAQAPVRFLVAGMGDALATWFEADSCRRSSSPNACGGWELVPLTPWPVSAMTRSWNTAFQPELPASRMSSRPPCPTSWRPTPCSAAWVLKVEAWGRLTPFTTD